MRGNSLTVEDGGINVGYCKWLRARDAENSWSGERSLHYEEWDSAGVNKMESASFIIQNGITIHIDEIRFSILSKLIGDCHWETDTTEIKIAKDKADSPHALDAFLHATSKKNRIDSQIEINDW
jgi:hypothetical protein